MDVFIYLLIDPRTNEPRYVGKTINCGQRLTDHCKEQGSTHKNHWLAVLKRLGLMPIMEVIETIKDSNDNDWQQRERYWIEYFFGLGLRLTNLDTGGIEGKSHCEETRKKIGASKVGKKRAAWIFDKIKATKRERLTPERRAKLGNGMRGKKHSAETIARIKAYQLGRPKSAEHRLKISLANKGIRPAQHTLDAAAAAKKLKKTLIPSTYQSI